MMTSVRHRGFRDQGRYRRANGKPNWNRENTCAEGPYEATGNAPGFRGPEAREISVDPRESPMATP
jgi:hypothetical protein